MKDLHKTLYFDKEDLKGIADARLWAKNLSQKQYDEIMSKIDILEYQIEEIRKETGSFEAYLTIRNSLNKDFYPIEQYGVVDYLDML